VFETPLSQSESGEGAFGREVESWEQKDWVREVKREKLKGSTLGQGRWWEGTNGVTKGLIEGLLEEIKTASAGRLNIHYEVMVSDSDAKIAAAPIFNPPSLFLNRLGNQRPLLTRRRTL
jgi:hypothetical protein